MYSFVLMLNTKLTKTFLRYIAPKSDEPQWENGPRIWHGFAANYLQEDAEL